MTSRKRIAISFLGKTKIVAHEVELPQFATRRARSLFSFLVLNRGQFHRREYLADLLWPEKDGGGNHSSLRTELWRIRTAFTKACHGIGRIFEEQDNSIRFRPSAECSLDIDEFNSCIIVPAGSAPSSTALLRAVELYQGDLLPSLEEDWCVYHRELYRARHLSALEQLVEYSMKLRKWSEAIDYGLRLLVQDPVAEHVHCKIIRCHVAMGNRAAAIRQFEICQARMIADLGVKPLAETQRLFETIAKNGSETIATPLKDPICPQDFRAPNILESLASTRSYLQKAANALESTISGIRNSK